MRQTVVNNISIDYPEYITWCNDTYPIVVSSSTPNVGAEITVISPDGDSRTIRHLSELNNLTFYLDDIILALLGENISAWTVQMSLYQGSNQVGYFSFSMKVLIGKSFSTRSHGCKETILIYDLAELTKVQIYAPENGIITVSGHNYTVYEGLNSLNLSFLAPTIGSAPISMCLRDGVTPPVCEITGVDSIDPFSSLVYFSAHAGSQAVTIQGGDVFKRETIYPICHSLQYIESCDSDFVELRYTSADGETRFIGGKPISLTDSATQQEYAVMNTDLWISPHAVVTSSNQVLKIFVPNCPKDAWLQDIVRSEHVYIRNYAGDWVQVRLKTLSITSNNEDLNNYELEIYISE